MRANADAEIWREPAPESAPSAAAPTAVAPSVEEGAAEMLWVEVAD